MNINLDIINGLFEAIGSLMILRNIKMTYDAKRTEGVSILTTLYFMMWGVFNLVYYPSLGQTFSFIGGMLVTLTNAIWIGQIIYYRIKNKGIKYA